MSQLSFSTAAEGQLGFMSTLVYNVGRVPGRLPVHPSQDPWIRSDAPGDVRERRRSDRAGTHFFLFLALGLSFGCLGNIRKRSALPVQPSVVTGALMYPTGFRFAASAYHPFDLSERLVQTLIQQSPNRLQMFGPSEFRVFRPDDSRAWATTNALPLVRANGLHPDEVVAIIPWLENRVIHSHQFTVSSAGQELRRKTDSQNTLIAHLDVLHPSSGVWWLELSMEVPMDEWVENPPYDPHFQATLALEKMCAEAVRLLSPFLHQAPLRRLPSYQFNPSRSFEAQPENWASFQKEISALDALDSEIIRLNRMQFANPKLSDKELAYLAKHPPGLLLTESLGPFEKGDVILELHGRAATPAVWERSRFATTAIPVLVRKADGQKFTLSWP